MSSDNVEMTENVNKDISLLDDMSLEKAQQILNESRDKLRAEFTKRFEELCREMERVGLRLSTRQEIVDGRLGQIQISIV